MDGDPTSDDRLALDPAIESEIRALYHAKYDSYGSQRVDAYLDGLLDVEHHDSHLRELLAVADPAAATGPAKLLISGFGAGSEVFAALQLGVEEVCGVEVDPFLREVAERRLKKRAAVHLAIYDGTILPLPDGYFTLLTSSHIIEHTTFPDRYMTECIRVLAPCGVMSLEFPTRFHWKELHTGLPSVEWLPRRIRNLLLRLLSSRVSPLPESAKKKYREIFDTNLGQISLRTVRRALAASGRGMAVTNLTRPAPGVLRCIIRRREAAPTDRSLPVG